MSLSNRYRLDVNMTCSTGDTATPSPISLSNANWPNTIYSLPTQMTITPSPIPLSNSQTSSSGYIRSDARINMISPFQISTLQEPEKKTSIMIHNESRISPNRISDPQELSNSHSLVKDRTPHSLPQTPISNEHQPKKPIEVSTECYNVAIPSTYTDKGFGKEASRENTHPSVLPMNDTTTKSKKDSTRNTKATRDVLTSSTSTYTKKWSEGKETNPIGGLKGTKSKEKDVVDAKNKNLAIPEDRTMTTAAKATILELDGKSERKHATDVTIFANNYQFKKLSTLINKYKSLWDDKGGFVDIPED